MPSGLMPVSLNTIETVYAKNILQPWGSWQTVLSVHFSRHPSRPFEGTLVSPHRNCLTNVCRLARFIHPRILIAGGFLSSSICSCCFTFGASHNSRYRCAEGWPPHRCLAQRLRGGSRIRHRRGSQVGSCLGVVAICTTRS